MEPIPELKNSCNKPLIPSILTKKKKLFSTFNLPKITLTEFSMNLISLLKLSIHNLEILKILSRLSMKKMKMLFPDILNSLKTLLLNNKFFS